MIIYRPNKTTLAEAMDCVVEFQSEEDMKNYIVKEWASLFDKPLFEFEDIVIDNNVVTDDPRIGWKDTKYVCIKRLADRDYIKEWGCPQAIGFCATKYKKTNAMKRMFYHERTCEDETARQNICLSYHKPDGVICLSGIRQCRKAGICQCGVRKLSKRS